MNNEKTGKFIAQRRKEMNLNQKQLAEKLNVTDKAVSKWETGKGAPDISLLTEIACALDISVIELLEGEYLEKQYEQAQTEKIVIEALQKAKKERIKTAVSILTALAVLFTLANAAVYAYWGNRHKVLYSVDTVFVHQDKDNPDKYDLYFNCAVKNWWFDFNEHTYTLETEFLGEAGNWSYEADETEIISTNSKETSFIIHVEFDVSTVWEPVPTLEEIIINSRFSAYDAGGEQDERATLYMNDFYNVRIVMI